MGSPRRSRVKHPPLTPAQQAVVEANMGLVWKVAGRHSRRLPLSTSFDDLAQAGFVALCRAARHYDAGEGVKFSTYATISVRRAVVDELCYRSSLVHVPQEPLGARPGETRLDMVTRLRPMQMQASADGFHDHMGACMPDTDHEPLAPAEDIDEELDGQDRVGMLHDSIEAMPERDRFVIRARWFDGRTLQDIGDELRISKERVRQIEAKALEFLRDRIEITRRIRATTNQRRA